MNLVPFCILKCARKNYLQVTITGWGFTSRSSGSAQDALRAIPIKVFPQRVCNRTHSSPRLGAGQAAAVREHLPNLFTAGLLCAGYQLVLIYH